MTKILLLSFLSLALSACNSKIGLQPIEWQKGAPVAQMEALQQIDTTAQRKLKSASQKIEFAEQSFQGITVENSFIKKVSDVSNTPLLVRASITTENQKLDRLRLEEFERKRPTILNELQKAFPIFKKFPPEKIDVVIAHRRGFYEPLWKILYTDKSGVPWEVKVNNHLQVSSVKRVGSQFHDTIAIVFPKGPKMSPLQEVVLKGLVATPTLSNNRLFVSSQAEFKISDVTAPLKFTPQDARFDQVQVFYFLEESLNWFERKLNVSIPFKLNAEVHMGAPEKTNSAFYYQGKIRIGAGDDETYSRIPQDPSIIIHESVHALVDAVARLPFEGEGGSLNEGFADFFTALQLDNPNMAESSYLKGPFRRSVVNNYKLSDKTGGLYHDSGIASGTLWELRVKLGPDKAREIAILTLNRLVPSSDFEDFGTQLKSVLPEVLNQEDLNAALEIVTARGF